MKTIYDKYFSGRRHFWLKDTDAEIVREASKSKWTGSIKKIVHKGTITILSTWVVPYIHFEICKRCVSQMFGDLAGPIGPDPSSGEPLNTAHGVSNIVVMTCLQHY